jgi:hypothetical protein
MSPRVVEQAREVGRVEGKLEGVGPHEI